MREGRADLAVHSLKDVPMDMPDGFVLAAITAREDPRDAFVSNRYRFAVGAAGRRRRRHVEPAPRGAAARAAIRRSTIESLRGNVDTRLRKLDEGQYDAIILAAAGLKRLGLGTRIRALLDPDESLPAPGQGALAIECRADRADSSPRSRRSPIAARRSRRRRSARFRARLRGSCQTPLAAYAEWQEDRAVAARPARHARRSRCLARRAR